MGEENYNLCCVLFPNFAKSPLFTTLYLLLRLRFTKEEAGVRKQALPFVLARYIRMFDVISEVNCVLPRNLGKLVENNSSKTTRRKQLVENTRRKTRPKATRRKFSGGKLVARTDKIISDKYSPNFVITPCYELLNYYKVLTVTYKSEQFQAII